MARKQGFAVMVKTEEGRKRQLEIASMGGLIAQASGNAHNYTPEEAKTAGALGGAALLAKRGRAHMAEIGRKGALARARNREQAEVREAADCAARDDLDAQT